MKHELARIKDMKEIAGAAMKSGYYAVKSQDQALVKILTGMELGVGPMTALQQIAVVNDKPVLGSALIAAKIKESGKYDYRRIGDNEKAVCIILQKNLKGDAYEEIGRETWTIEDAKRAGLTGKNNWKNYPAAMLWARALTQAARMLCPDVFMGAVYAPEEMGVEEDDDGNLVEAQVVKSTVTDYATVKMQQLPEPLTEDEIESEPVKTIEIESTGDLAQDLQNMADVQDDEASRVLEMKKELSAILSEKGVSKSVQKAWVTDTMEKNSLRDMNSKALSILISEAEVLQ